MAASDLKSAILELNRAQTTSELICATQAVSALMDLEAAPTLIKVLGFNNPSVAAVAIQGLIALGRNVVPVLLTNLDERDYSARAWAIQAIATLRDSRGLDLLERAISTDIAPSVRRSATRGLAEMELGGPTFFQDFSRCCKAIFKAATDDEWVVRYAAAFGIEQRFTPRSSNHDLDEQARVLLRSLASDSEKVKVVRLRAQHALKRLQA
ncbi:HEAT repeat domain-containing protein [Synechococcus sp. M16CYN]|uniref:HEAT repeat domain-containing protein n=1 Tax=Synechococcus sp. M16CYN TaxID=3103139 RepID=UPI0030E22BAA